MVKFTFRGLMAPVFTPFNYDSERSLNLSLIPKYAEYLTSAGIHGILVNGTSGEGVSQSVDERVETAAAWTKEGKRNGQTVMVQVGGVGLPDVKKLAAHAEEIGADALLCLADLFHQPRCADDLLHYLRQVSDAAPKTPLLYYHIPAFNGIDVNMKEMLEKARDNPSLVPTLVGIKYTCNDLSMGASCIAVDEENFAVFLGSDTILAGAFCIGFDSAIGTSLNMMAALNHSIVKAIACSDVTTARRDQRKLSAAIGSIAKHGSWISTMKTAMRLMTPLDVGPARSPLINLKDCQVKQISSDLKGLQLL